MHRTNLIKFTELTELTEDIYRADYDTFYIGAYVRERIDVVQFELERLMEGKEDIILVYKNKDDISAEINVLKEKLDTVKALTPELSFYLPFWFYQLEDGVRSIHHAEQYFGQKIIYRYLKMVLSYLPFVLMLFFMFPFLSQRTFLSMLVFVGVFVFAANFQYGETLQIKYDIDKIGETGQIIYKTPENELTYGLHKEKFLPCLTMGLTVLSLLLAFVMPFFNRDKKELIDVFLNLFVVAAIATAIIPLFIENKNEYLEKLLPESFMPYFSEDYIYYSKTWVFYLTAAMCLIAPVLFSYLKGLPKSR